MDIRDFFEYEDGDLLCKKWYTRRIRVGDKLGGNKEGYRYGRFNKINKPIGSWVFYYFHGRFPRKLAHVDGDIRNNSIENLIEVPDLTPMTKEWARFHFDYKDGGLIRKVGTPVSRVGDLAGTKGNNGYVLVTVERKPYLAHRIVWVYFNDGFSKQTIDHINGDRSDNRIENLREASFQENTRNRKKAAGISFVNKAGKYQATICVDGKTIYLGLFSKASDALVARREAELKYFGDFSK